MIYNFDYEHLVPSKIFTKSKNVVIDNFKEKSHLKIVNDGEVYGTFLDDKMLAWIFLTISYRIRK